MNSKCRGFVLLLTLCLIALISLLSLTGMRHVLLYYKAISTQGLQQHLFHEMEQFALQLIKAKDFNTSNQGCIIRDKSPEKAFSLLVNNQGCNAVRDQEDYQYIIQDLEEYPCLQIEKDSKKYSVHQRLFSILLKGNDRHTPSLLQLRTMKAGSETTCQGTALQIYGGVTSWRYIADVSTRFINQSNALQ